MLRSTNNAVINLKNEYQENGNLIQINKDNIKLIKSSFFLNINDTEFIKYIKFLGRTNLIGINDGVIESIFVIVDTILILVYYMGKPISPPGTTFNPTSTMTRILFDTRPDLFTKDYLFKFSKVIKNGGKIIKIGYDGIIAAKSSSDARNKLKKYKEYSVEEISLYELKKLQRQALKDYKELIELEKTLK